MNSDETEPLEEAVKKLRSWFPKPEKADLSECFAMLLRASRMRYGTIIPALDVIWAYLDPLHEVDELMDFATNGGMVLLELAKALELTRASGGYIGSDPDPDGRYVPQEEPDDILMGIS